MSRASGLGTFQAGLDGLQQQFQYEAPSEGRIIQGFEWMIIIHDYWGF
jgi:hypothetical protein